MTQRTRTDAYRFTVTSLDSPLIRELKHLVKIQNVEDKLSYLVGGHEKYNRRRVVAIKARLGKDSPYAHLYRKGGELYRRSAQTIRPEHGAHFDVYVHIRY